MMAAVDYEILEGDLSSCLTCGAVVTFNHLTTHTRWHEIMEPAWPLAKTEEPAPPAPPANSPGE